MVAGEMRVVGHEVWMPRHIVREIVIVNRCLEDAHIAYNWQLF